ncbi:hypothetical protein B0H13DRAFT_2371032 [Mycena leptocephala]|nr:hypothetical protein B0H13DRAFT_2371032 [Mycena leptocephala]
MAENSGASTDNAGLSGSSKDNPWCMDAGGHLALQTSEMHRGGDLKKVRRQPKKIIFEGPASTITPDVRRRRVAPVPQPSSSALTRVLWRKGKRAERVVPLTEDDLYLDGARPPVFAPSAGHRCQLCHCIKSHPVSNNCGHSYCYVCIRLRLEREWTCPYANCNRVIHMAPRIDVGEQESIKADYPDLGDESRVSYSWEGLLRFPRAPKPIEVFSSP